VCGWGVGGAQGKGEEVAALKDLFSLLITYQSHEKNGHY